VADYSLVTLGAFVFDGDSAALVGDLTIGAVPRTVTVAANALSSAPVQVCDYVSDYGEIAFQAKLAGRETVGETAANHLQRMLANLRTEVAKDSNTLTVDVWGMTTPYVYHIHKNADMDTVITTLTQSRSVIELAVKLKYLP
jgi:hypothetical protein